MTEEFADERVGAYLPETEEVEESIWCPKCGCDSYFVTNFVIHLNDEHQLPFNEIADILEETETKYGFKMIMGRYRMELIRGGGSD